MLTTCVRLRCAQDIAEGAIATVVRNQDGRKSVAIKAAPDPGEVEARPIADFAPAVASRPVNFLKIDVEGFELHGELCSCTCSDYVSRQRRTESDSFDHNAALRRFTATGIMSAYGLFGSKAPSAADAPDAATTAVAGTGSNLFARVQHVVVEFGPPRRWSVAKNSAEDGARVLAEMENDYGFEPRYELPVGHLFARKVVSASLTADCNIYVRHF